MIRRIALISVGVLALPMGALALEPGDIVAVGSLSGGDNAGLFGIDPVTGDRTMFSSCPTTCGPAPCLACEGGVTPAGEGPGINRTAELAFEPAGTIAIIANPNVHVLRVDPTTGDRSTVSRWCQSPPCMWPDVGTGPAWTPLSP